LRMDRSPLQRALHADRVTRRDFLALGQSLHLLIEITLELALEGIEVGTAMLEHIAGGDVMQHRVEQMLQADIFVTPVDRLGHRKLQGYLKFPADVYRRRHERRGLYSFSIVHFSGYSAWRASSSTVRTLVSAISNG